jgi:hypothetical protein
MNTTQTPPTTPSEPVRSAADKVMRRILFLDVNAAKATPDEARKAFQTSILVATVRCLLMYIVFPFVLPALGLAAGVGPAIGLPIGIAAILAITMSVRRFWRADHSKRWHYTVIGTTVIVFLSVLVVRDLLDLIG